MCENPFLVRPKSDKYPKIMLSDFHLANCGKCPECLIKQSKEWSHRIELEMKYYENKSAFVTLTISDDHMVDPSLDRRDIQLFIKRLRKRLDGREIKYYAVGEYGPKHLRKHYHLVLMNVDGKDSYGNNERQRRQEPVVGEGTDWHAIHESWGKGIVDTQVPRGGIAHYVSGYMVKSNSRKNDIERLGLEPEFRLMSKGLGKRQILKLAEKINKMPVKPNLPINYIEYNGKFKKPLGRYLKEKLHEAIGQLRTMRMANRLYNYYQLKKWSIKGVEYITESYLGLTEYERTAKYALAKLKMGVI